MALNPDSPKPLYGPVHFHFGLSGLSSLIGLISLFGLPHLAAPPWARQIIMTLYTVQNGSVKMTAQMDSAEVAGKPSRKASLELFLDNAWAPGDTGKAMTMPGWTFHFRIDKWDDTRDVAYRVRYDTGSWHGVIRKDPGSQPVIKVGVVSCISPSPAHGGDLPVADIIRNIRAQGADLLVFNGDQVYNHDRHTENWRSFAYKFAELTRDIPAICQTDDHDVGTANLWGSGGKASATSAGDDGGYFKPVDYVNMVQRVQTWHLPDPYDPAPVQRGISVYYTDMTWGEISFAILEDRKWKTGPQEVLEEKPGPRWDHVTDPDFDVAAIDVPAAVLLGDRQHRFLREWGADWKGAKMKCVLTQSPYANLAHLHGGRNNRLIADLDANGWPQRGRNRALHDIRRAFAFTIAGDQHLTTVVQHGIDEWRDAGWSFTAPAVSNLYLRWWAPLAEGLNRPAGKGPEYGDHLDGFRNKVTMHAFGNPGVLPGSPAVFYDRSAGYGLVKFDKRTRKITMEAWPRETDVTRAGAGPYAGWPVTVDQEDNYGRKAVEHLPTVSVKGLEDPVVQVIDPAAGRDSVVYTLRIRGSTFRPKVFRPGTYALRVGEFGTRFDTTLTGIRSLPDGQSATLAIAFSPVAVRPRSRPRPAAIGKDLEVSWLVPYRSILVKTGREGMQAVEVLDAKGSVVHSRTLQGPGDFVLSVPGLAPGGYAVRVDAGGRTRLYRPGRNPGHTSSPSPNP